MGLVLGSGLGFRARARLRVLRVKGSGQRLGAEQGAEIRGVGSGRSEICDEKSASSSGCEGWQNCAASCV